MIVYVIPSLKRVFGNTITRVIVPHLPSIPGLLLKLDNQDLPFASFTYALTPLTNKLTPVDWKLLVTNENLESQNIRCHELQDGDNLPELIAGFQKAHAVSIVLINTSDDYILHHSFLSEMQECHFPVVVLSKCDGMELLKKVEQYKENVFAKISIENFVDLPVQTSVETTENGHITLHKMACKEAPFNLKAELKDLMFTAGKPLVICEDSVTFTMVMSTFKQYEKYVSIW